MEVMTHSERRFEESEEGSVRNIWRELLDANYLSVIGDPLYRGGLEVLRLRRHLVAQEVLAKYPGDLLLTSERFHEEGVFGESLIWLQSNFDFRAWEGRTLNEFLWCHGSWKDHSLETVLQYSIKKPNRDGVHARNITFREIQAAVPAGDSGWKLPSGIEIKLSHWDN